MQQDFLELRKGLDAALVSLDLASLLWEQGRTEELKQLASEVVVVFESREVHFFASEAMIGPEGAKAWSPGLAAFCQPRDRASKRNRKP